MANVIDIKAGTVDVIAVYAGSNLVWPEPWDDLWKDNWSPDLIAGTS